MKRVLALALTISMTAALAAPLTGCGTQDTTKAVAAAGQSQEALVEAEDEAVPQSSFDESISSLYDNSMNVTDEEVIAAAEQMNSDFTQHEAALGSDADSAMECLKAYEESKSGYMLKTTTETIEPAISSEWDRQMEYTSYLITEGDTVKALVPRMKVLSCTEKDGKVDMDVYEWMTVGYANGDGPMNASAYGYNYALTLDRKGDGWVVAAVYDTDQNFDWMQEEAEEAAQMNQSSKADPADLSQRVISEDGTKMMMAASRINFSYSRDKAIAYGDKYCINYNSSYNSYKGRGGDCANFVSQCLHAGGFPQDNNWYKHSVAWINVMKQIAHFKSYGTFLKAENSNILRGNPLYFDWNGDGVWDHATICVGRNNNGTAIIDSHTRDLYHSTYSYADYDYISTIQLRDSGTSTGIAVSGSWVKNQYGWYYKNGDGSLLKNTFREIGGIMYHFDSNGYMDTGWTTINGVKYYFDPSTGEITVGWRTISGKQYYFDKNGVRQTGWQQIDGKWYYFHATGGYKLTGWLTLGKTTYYLGTDGAMVKNTQTIGGVTYKFDGYGRLLSDPPAKTVTKSNGWVKSGGNTYYYKKGKKVTGWQTISGKKYYFTANGVMLLRWKRINGKKYLFDPKSGYMHTGWEYVTEKGGWYYLDPQKGYLLEGWVLIGKDWYYLKPGDGIMLKGWQLRALIAILIPRPCSALSSNSELHHAGPCPSAFVV